MKRHGSNGSKRQREERGWQLEPAVGHHVEGDQTNHRDNDEIAAEDLYHTHRRALVEQAPRPVHLKAQEVVYKIGNGQRDADAIQDVAAKANVALRSAGDTEAEDARDPWRKPRQSD